MIEFVETHKIPIMERLGIYMDVTKRDQEKPLPDWMLSFMKFGESERLTAFMFTVIYSF